METPSLRVVSYCRVSTRDKQNPDLQRDALRDLVFRRGWTLVDEYCDVGVSGSKDSRPQLDRLMAEARQPKRKFDAVLVVKLDRFGRSMIHLVTVLEELHQLGIQFISLRDNLDFSTAAGKLMFHVIASFAEFERDLIRERVQAGVDHARANGVQLGRRKRIFNVDQAKALLAEGGKLSDVARELGVSRSTLERRIG